MEFVLRVLDNGDVLHIPLGLTGGETEKEAIERFRDALVVARHNFAERRGYSPPLVIMRGDDGTIINRIDGKEDFSLSHVDHRWPIR